MLPETTQNLKDGSDKPDFNLAGVPLPSTGCITTGPGLSCPYIFPQAGMQHSTEYFGPPAPGRAITALAVWLAVGKCNEHCP